MALTCVRNCQFSFKCSKQWEELTRTSFERVRHCASCSRDVFYCATDAELAESVKLNRCVAVDLPDTVGYPNKDNSGQVLIRTTVGVVSPEPRAAIDKEEVDPFSSTDLSPLR